MQPIGILFRALQANRAALAMGNPALHQQLAVLERSVSPLSANCTLKLPACCAT